MVENKLEKKWNCAELFKVENEACSWNYFLGTVQGNVRCKGHSEGTEAGEEDLCDSAECSLMSKLAP